MRLVTCQAGPPDLVSILLDIAACRRWRPVSRTLRAHLLTGASIVHNACRPARQHHRGRWRPHHRSRRSQRRFGDFWQSRHAVSRFTQARCSASWAPMAPASPPPFACSADCCRPAADSCVWPASICARAARQPAPHRLHVAEVLPLRQPDGAAESAILLPAPTDSPATPRQRSGWALDELELDALAAPKAATCPWALSSGWPWHAP